MGKFYATFPNGSVGYREECQVRMRGVFTSTLVINNVDSAVAVFLARWLNHIDQTGELPDMNDKRNRPFDLKKHIAAALCPPKKPIARQLRDGRWLFIRKDAAKTTYIATTSRPMTFAEAWEQFERMNFGDLCNQND